MWSPTESGIVPSRAGSRPTVLLIFYRKLVHLCPPRALRSGHRALLPEGKVWAGQRQNSGRIRTPHGPPVASPASSVFPA